MELTLERLIRERNDLIKDFETACTRRPPTIQEALKFSRETSRLDAEIEAATPDVFVLIRGRNLAPISFTGEHDVQHWLDAHDFDEFEDGDGDIYFSASSSVHGAEVKVYALKHQVQ